MQPWTWTSHEHFPWHCGHLSNLWTAQVRLKRRVAGFLEEWCQQFFIGNLIQGGTHFQNHWKNCFAIMKNLQPRFCWPQVTNLDRLRYRVQILWSDIWEFWIWELHAVLRFRSSPIFAQGFLRLHNFCQSRTFSVIHPCSYLWLTLWRGSDSTACTTSYTGTVTPGEGYFPHYHTRLMTHQQSCIIQRRWLTRVAKSLQVDSRTRVYVDMSTWTISLERRSLKKVVFEVYLLNWRVT